MDSALGSKCSTWGQINKATSVFVTKSCVSVCWCHQAFTLFKTFTILCKVLFGPCVWLQQSWKRRRWGGQMGGGVRGSRAASVHLKKINKQKPATACWCCVGDGGGQRAQRAGFVGATNGGKTAACTCEGPEGWRGSLETSSRGWPPSVCTQRHCRAGRGQECREGDGEVVWRIRPSWAQEDAAGRRLSSSGSSRQPRLVICCIEKSCVVLRATIRLTWIIINFH